MIVGNKKFNWKKTRLLLGTKDTGFSIQPHSTYKNMYYIRWPDGGVSIDFYNRSWAKNNCMQIAMQHYDIQDEGETYESRED